MLSGNQYTFTFNIYWDWPEEFAEPKKAQTIDHLVLDELFPRYSTPSHLVIDNGNVNKFMKEMLEGLNIYNGTSPFYHPESNAKVETLNRTMHDILSK